MRGHAARARAWAGEVGLEVPAIEASSTEIRRRLAAGEPVADLLPPGVEEFIRQKGLYRVPKQG